MPKPYRSEFRDDVVGIARNRAPGVTTEQIAMTLQKWLRRADIDEGAKPGQSRTDSAELREAQADPAARAGEQGSAARGGVFVPGEPAGKRSTRS